jgi:hypothetical protein
MASRKDLASIADTLSRLVESSPQSAEGLGAWYAAAREADTQIRSRYSDVQLPAIVTHFMHDADIRIKDPVFRDSQLAAIRAVILSLERGVIPHDRTVTIRVSLRGAIIVLGLLVTAVLLLGCAFVPKEQPWDFVTAVGGIAVPPPQSTPKGLLLGVRADGSGLQAITNEPATMNSIMSCSVTRANVAGQDILLTISTSLMREGGSYACPPAKLGKLLAGRYTVLYGSKRAGAKPIGVIDVVR